MLSPNPPFMSHILNHMCKQRCDARTVTGAITTVYVCVCVWSSEISDTDRVWNDECLSLAPYEKRTRTHALRDAL